MTLALGTLVEWIDSDDGKKTYMGRIAGYVPKDPYINYDYIVDFQGSHPQFHTCSGFLKGKTGLYCVDPDSKFNLDYKIYPINIDITIPKNPEYANLFI